MCDCGGEGRENFWGGEACNHSLILLNRGETFIIFWMGWSTTKTKNIIAVLFWPDQFFYVIKYVRYFKFFPIFFNKYGSVKTSILFFINPDCVFICND